MLLFVFWMCFWKGPKLCSLSSRNCYYFICVPAQQSAWRTCMRRFVYHALQRVVLRESASVTCCIAARRAAQMHDLVHSMMCCACAGTCGGIRLRPATKSRWWLW